MKKLLLSLTILTSLLTISSCDKEKELVCPKTCSHNTQNSNYVYGDPDLLFDYYFNPAFPAVQGLTLNGVAWSGPVYFNDDLIATAHLNYHSTSGNLTLIVNRHQGYLDTIVYPISSGQLQVYEIIEYTP